MLIDSCKSCLSKILLLSTLMSTHLADARSEKNAGIINYHNLIGGNRIKDTAGEQFKTLKEFTIHDNKDEGRTFIINTCIRDLDEFRKLVKLATRLKPYGTVQINISTLADKGFYEIPKGGSPWHEYASNKQTPYKFFPDPKIVPFIPAEFVKKTGNCFWTRQKFYVTMGWMLLFLVPSLISFLLLFLMPTQTCGVPV